MENKRNTRANVKKNPGIKLQTDLPPRGRQNWAVKRNQTRRSDCTHEPVNRGENAHLTDMERELSYHGSRSHPELSGDDFFSTPKLVCPETVRQQIAPNLDERMSSNLFQRSTNPFLSDFSQEEIRQMHLEP